MNTVFSRIRMISFAAAIVIVWAIVIRPTGAATIVVESVRSHRQNTAVSAYGLTHEDVRQLKATLSDAWQIVPIRKLPQQARVGEQVADLELIGTLPALADISEMSIQQGRFLIPKDIDHRTSVVVLESQIARRLFRGDQVVGSNVRIGNQYFLVVGLIDSASTSASPKRRGNSAYIPLTTMLSRYGHTAINRHSGRFEIDRYELSQIRIESRSATTVHAVADTVRSLLEKRHDKRDFSIRVL